MAPLTRAMARGANLPFVPLAVKIGPPLRLSLYFGLKFF